MTADRPSEILFRIQDASDVVVARQKLRQLGLKQGLSEIATEALAIAATELARNILVHAGCGLLTIGEVRELGRRGVVVTARDEGPGIRDVDEAMLDGFTTGDGLGLGLPSARRLVDEFEIRSTPGAGTTVTLRKWADPETKRW